MCAYIYVCQISLSLCLKAGPHDAANIRWYQLYTQFCDRGSVTSGSVTVAVLTAHIMYLYISHTQWSVGYTVCLSVYYVSLYISQTLWYIWYTSESIYIHSTCHHILFEVYYLNIISLITQHLLVRYSVYQQDACILHNMHVHTSDISYCMYQKYTCTLYNTCITFTSDMACISQTQHI